MGARRSVTSPVGKTYGRLTVIRELPRVTFKCGSVKRKVQCVCRCGGQPITVLLNSLQQGQTQSCGCLQRERASEARTTHGHTRGGNTTKAYRTWISIWRRTTNPNTRDYPNYGGRGIKVCRRWRSFEAFLGDMGEPPPEGTIDRINVDRDYTPSNCRWVPKARQNRNRRDSFMITLRGTKRCLAEWAEITGLRAATIRKRIKELGWPPRKALTTGTRAKDCLTWVQGEV